MINENCSVRYCQKCKTKLNQKYAREDDNIVVRTRKCPKCGYTHKTVEMLLVDYNSTVRKLNTIIGVVSDSSQDFVAHT